MNLLDCLSTRLSASQGFRSLPPLGPLNKRDRGTVGLSMKLVSHLQLQPTRDQIKRQILHKYCITHSYPLLCFSWYFSVLPGWCSNLQETTTFFPFPSLLIVHNHSTIQLCIIQNSWNRVTPPIRNKLFGLPVNRRVGCIMTWYSEPRLWKLRAKRRWFSN